MAAAVLVGLNPETQVMAKSPLAWIWKSGGYTDYAPNGVPDFDQKQACWGPLAPCLAGFPPAQYTYCGPVAAANSMWWFDSKFEPFPQPPTVNNENYFLITTYLPWKGMGLDDHDPVNVGGMMGPGVPAPPGIISPPSLVEDLAWYFDTDGQRTHPPVARTGTVVQDMFYGLQWWLYGGNPAWGPGPAGPRAGSYYDDYHVQMVKAPAWNWVVGEVKRSEDVVLLLGFWEEVPPLSGYFERRGGHFVTVAGIDPDAQQIAFSDPYYDFAETPIGAGFVYSGTIPGYTHTLIPAHASYIHNDAGNVSHDTYSIVQVFPPPTPHWMWEVLNYNYNANFVGQNTPSELVSAPPFGFPMHTFVEYAVAVSPFTWKPGGEWVYQYYGGKWIWEWWSYEDDGDSCVPDFRWSGISIWPKEAYDGATALADSLWWFDSKAETLVTGGFPEPPPTINDNYQLVTSYDEDWDDHAISNTLPLISDLADYLNTDVHGTTKTNMAAGIQDYLETTGTDNDFYTETQEAPSFDWVADEVIECEDVVMLLGFYENVAPGEWERKGGHWVDAAGVSKESGQIGLSDPWPDGSNVASFFDIVYDGRVFPPEHLGTPFTDEEKKQPQSISHDIYFSTTTSVDPYLWALEDYPVDDVIDHAIGLNGGGEAIEVATNLLTTVVEWAMGVSPYSDLVITKTALVTEFTATDPITYVIEYANTGLAAVSDVIISDTLPITVLTNLAYTAVPPLTANAGTPYSWSIPKLSYGQTGVITVTAVVTEPSPSVLGNYTNIATISTATSERSPSNNDSQATFQLGDFLYLPIVKK
jgi:uncharacterized repeat protein (TIGR01451 family)